MSRIFYFMLDTVYKETAKAPDENLLLSTRVSLVPVKQTEQRPDNLSAVRD